MNVNAPFPYSRRHKCLVAPDFKIGMSFLKTLGVDLDEWIVMPIFGYAQGMRFERIVVMTHHSLYSAGPRGRVAYEAWFEGLKLRLPPGREDQVFHL